MGQSTAVRNILLALTMNREGALGRNKYRAKPAESSRIPPILQRGAARKIGENDRTVAVQEFSQFFTGERYHSDALDGDGLINKSLKLLMHVIPGPYHEFACGVNHMDGGENAGDTVNNFGFLGDMAHYT